MEQKPTENVPIETTDYSAPEYWDEDKSPEGYTYYWNTVTGGKWNKIQCFASICGTEVIIERY